MFMPRRVLRFAFSRGSGPGGQNVNKVSSRVQLRVALKAIAEVIGEEATQRLRQQQATRINEADELIIVAEDTRSQLTNRRRCVARLGAMMVQARKRPRVRKATRPSKAMHERRLESKTKRSRIKRMRRKPDHDD